VREPVERIAGCREGSRIFLRLSNFVLANLLVCFDDKWPDTVGAEEHCMDEDGNEENRDFSLCFLENLHGCSKESHCK